jgi:SAM-dependent methyltransferase
MGAMCFENETSSDVEGAAPSAAAAKTQENAVSIIHYSSKVFELRTTNDGRIGTDPQVPIFYQHRTPRVSAGFDIQQQFGNAMPADDSTRRFSDRVDNYVRYRPGYPEATVAYLETTSGLKLAAGTTVADVGSGTGISSELFLRHGATVYGVEPNADMRAAAESLLSRYPNFHSIAGTAEATTLADRSVDGIVAGQAFHWFDRQKCRDEFARIVRPGGFVALVWNTLRTEATPFMSGYEALRKEFGTDYAAVRHENIEPAVLRNWFDAGTYRTAKFPHHQEFDLEGLIGRLLSSSYLPSAGQPGHEEMVAAAKRLFEMNEQADRVALEYNAEVHVGRVT